MSIEFEQIIQIMLPLHDWHCMLQNRIAYVSYSDISLDGNGELNMESEVILSIWKIVFQLNIERLRNINLTLKITSIKLLKEYLTWKY